MAEAQKCYGSDHLDLRALGRAAFARSLFRILPEDKFDRQPLVGGEGRLLLTADVRLDNREELTAALGIDSRRLSDSAVLLAALERWSEDALERLAGDFAFALWDETHGRLLLARDPLGARPLHYVEDPAFLAFASMPVGLYGARLVERSPDKARAAEFLADVPRQGSSSFFAGIQRVEAGHAVIVTPGCVRSRRYWSPRRCELRLPRRDDYIEAFRAQLDQAVGARLRGAEGRVGSHLSSGFDSGAVTATAARLLAEQGGRVRAYTAAPRLGFDGPVPSGRIADESPIAALTARMHPNIDHVIVRPPPGDPFGHLSEKHLLVQHPVGHLCNDIWWTAINRDAQTQGLNVMLTGQVGNHSLSAGGAAQLADLLREGRPAAWWREARALSVRHGLSWRGILALSAGPWLPRRGYELLRRASPAGSAPLPTPFLVGADWKEAIARKLARAAADPRPPRDSFAFRTRLLQLEDGGNFQKYALAQWGTDVRDPTGDRRLIDFCFSLPLDQLLKDGERRPLAKAALADRLPPEALNGTLRGYQAADWYQSIGPDDVCRALSPTRNVPAAREVINFAGVDALIESWPSEGWERRSVISRHRMALLRAVAVADFLRSASS
jgi:asparagine synthase (glutamine-hydrolysing)